MHHRGSSPLATPRTSRSVDEPSPSSSLLGPQQRQHTRVGAGDFGPYDNASLSADPDVPPGVRAQAVGADVPRRSALSPASRRLHHSPVSSSASSSSSTTSADSDAESDSASSHGEGGAADSRKTTQSATDGTATTTAAAAATAKSNKRRSTRARHWLKKRLIPQFMSEYGKTVYGGAPLAQQTLPGIFNYPSPFPLVPLFFAFMIPFVVVGALMLVEGPRHRVVEAEYSHIHQYQYVPTDPAVNINQGLLKFTAEGATHAQGTRTWLQVNITRHLKGPVYMYYKLDNFYQNYRDFHDGRSIPQLTGKQKLGNIYTCKPYTHPGFREGEMDTPIVFTDASGAAVNTTLASFTYSPCGIAPWSKFNDTFVLYRQLTAAEAAAAAAAGTTVVMGGEDGTAALELVCNGTDFGLRGEPLGGSVAPNHCAKDGITWRADRDVRYHNMTLRQDWWSLYYPYPTTNEYLRNGWYLHEPGHALPDPSDYDLQVWMRAAFVSSFHKLYRIIAVDLSPGVYWVDITEVYDVVTFRGRKSIVLHNGNWTGGRNIVLGVVFIVMGCLSFIVGVAFTVECLLQRNGVNRYEHLQEPKRSWYVFPPDDAQFAQYYQLRLRRHIPLSQLQALRKTVEELEGLAPGSQDGSLAQQQQPSNGSGAEASDRDENVAPQPRE
ncbi:hypothetical protein ABB37_06992 [Leptomonas pyrrhocoris]|uniref:Uncharacterized protein n=1 Tax=Leptomonas pyrrhocoris TaxID=157538 RepID=A0A0M9FX13_LEPPY|nr:hypothetical protein ABB37_06992 [Leptomonas pyrrhocoris]KPA77636.1 hypothetical protein ABB37_06992 [Leptomonas pyrrhocoris]|eukprot:XP_015656075.1 hypothetical protein ABB37_06992 [Leptomonas pyrrhocoris]